MSHPNPSHDRSNEYPSDHYKPGGKKLSPHKTVADFHKSQMGHMMELMRGHHKSKALAKRTGKKKILAKKAADEGDHEYRF